MRQAILLTNVYFMFTKKFVPNALQFLFFFDNKKRPAMKKYGYPIKCFVWRETIWWKALFHCSTVPPLHCCTVAQYCCCTLQLLDHCTVALLYHCTTPPLHSIAIALLNCCTIALLHCQTRLPQVLLSLWLSKQKTSINIWCLYTHTWLFSVFFMGLWGYISTSCNLLKEL